MKKYRQQVLLLAGSIAIQFVSAQTVDSSAHALKEVVVTGVREEAIRHTALSIQVLPAEKIAASAAPTLALALTEVPGVQRLGTGQGIGKPVVRGLYGNRVLVLLDGLKFDNQQWQDEHGLGLSGIGVGRTEVVMGPAAVLYGSEAVGGVINILGERPDPERPGWQADGGVRYFTNTAGFSADAGMVKNTARGWWQVRAGAENHADYAEGEGHRVLNSRFAAYNLRASLARIGEGRQTTFHFTSSVSNFGFVLEDLGSFFEPDARYSRSLEGPHHTVFLHIFSVENSAWKERSTFRYNVGLQSNLRLEDEGGGAISLNMHLVSLPWTLRWTRDLGNGHELIVSGVGALERNTNYGALATGGVGRFPLNVSTKVLLRFDLAAIPATATVVSSSLTVQTSTSSAGTVSLFRAKVPWSEATVTWLNFGAGQDSVLQASASDGGAGYAFEASMCNEVLFNDNVASDVRHAFTQNWDFGASGLVWSGCKSAGSRAFQDRDDRTGLAAASEYHHSLAMACLVEQTEIADAWQALNRLYFSSGAGHTATQSVFWNNRGGGRLLSMQYGWGYVVGTVGLTVLTELAGLSGQGSEPEDFVELVDLDQHGFTLTPSSLYEDQLQRRQIALQLRAELQVVGLRKVFFFNFLAHLENLLHAPPDAPRSARQTQRTDGLAARVKPTRGQVSIRTTRMSYSRSTYFHSSVARSSPTRSSKAAAYFLS